MQSEGFHLRMTIFLRLFPSIPLASPLLMASHVGGCAEETETADSLRGRLRFIFFSEREKQKGDEEHLVTAPTHPPPSTPPPHQ